MTSSSPSLRCFRHRPGGDKVATQTEYVKCQAYCVKELLGLSVEQIEFIQKNSHRLFHSCRDIPDSIEVLEMCRQLPVDQIEEVAKHSESQGAYRLAGTLFLKSWRISMWLSFPINTLQIQ